MSWTPPSGPPSEPGWGEDGGWAPPPSTDRPPVGDPTAPYGPPAGYGPSPAYGPPQQPGYGQPPAYGYQPQPYGYGAAEHPQGTTILVLGICSLVFGFSCGVGFLLGPVAWIMGNSAIKEVDADPSRYGNRGSVQAGRICGMVSTGLLALGLLAFFGLLLAAGLGSSSSS